VTDGKFERLEQDLRALVATLEDPAEAQALEALFTLAGQLEPELDSEKEYKPFVYPH
jgi:hypothetical protein